MKDIQEIIRTGEQAKALLESEAFNSVLNELYDVWKTELFGTDPSAKERREQLYNLHLALQHVHVAVASMAASGQQALEALETEQEE